MSDDTEREERAIKQLESAGYEVERTPEGYVSLSRNGFELVVFIYPDDLIKFAEMVRQRITPSA